MESSKVKNIIIIILLALNMFFLVLFLIGRSESGKLERQAKEDIISLFSETGITVEASVIPSDSAIGYYKMTRDLDSEKLIADTMLGTKDMTATGGGVYQYSNMLGEALFYPQGDFSVTLTSGKALKDTSDTAIIKFLNDLKIEARIDSIVPESADSRKTTVYLSGIFNKVKIINAKITMVFDGEKLISISGKRLIADPVYADSKIMGVKTALIYFRNEIKSLDPACKKINAVTATYHISDDGSGGAVLLPVWRVDTNSGSYYVNGINGKVSEIFD